MGEVDLDFMLTLSLGLIIVPAIVIVILWLLGTAYEKFPLCVECGKEIKTKFCKTLPDGSKYHLNCFQKIFDKQGATCFICKDPIRASQDFIHNADYWYHEKCYQNEVYSKEGISPKQIAILANAIRVYCRIPTVSEAVDDCIWGIADPMYGLYKKSQKHIGEISPEDAKSTIKQLYLSYPESVTLILKRFAQNVAYMSILSLLTVLEAEKKNQEIRPIALLKTRYAKGEITKEQYEEMKKTLES